MNKDNLEEAPVTSSKFPLRKVAGCGCGALAFIAVTVFAIASYLGINAEKPLDETNKQSTPAPISTPMKLPFPKIYLGKWQAGNGTSIHIRDDGKGDFHLKDTDVSGGTLVIDEKNKKLKISSVFDISQEWKIDRAPQTANGKTTMLLDNIEFQRTP